MIEIVPNWHPIFVHFTVALLSLSVLFFVIQRPLAQTEIGDNFLLFARYTLGLGILFTIGTVIAGIDAYNTVDHDTPSHLAMKDHRLWAIVTAVVFLLAWIWSLLSLKSEDKAGWLLIIILLFGAGLLITTGHKGSYLVYYYGLGVESLPETDEHDHKAHDHEAGAAHKHEEPGVSESHDHGSEPEAMHGQAQEAEADEHAKSSGHDDHAHSHDESSQPVGNTEVETAPQESESVEVIEDKDGIVRETLPAVDLPVQPVETQ